MMHRIVLLIVMMATLNACGGRGDAVTPVYPARPDGVYAQDLAHCARQRPKSQSSCALARLPMLGMEQTVLDKEAVMQRVAATHPWMAQRFEAVLDHVPVEMLTLMRSVTAIIIGSDVRPSFYWDRTGAIYLDAANLWLTVDEKRSIDPAPDYRSNFGAALNFRVISRYVFNNDYAWYSYSLDDDSTRSLEDIIAPLSRLLFHELAHAGDFFPPEVLAELPQSPGQTVEAAARAIKDQRRQISQGLAASAPLVSQRMRDLAQVNFVGADPTPQQLALRPPEVSAEFAPDGANDDYAYITRFEDVAMLFEEIMMSYSYGIERDVAVADKPQEGDPHVVQWGERRRIAAESVRARAEYVASRLSPDTDFTAFFAQQTPHAMRSGETWNENLDPAGASKRLGPEYWQDPVRDAFH